MENGLDFIQDLGASFSPWALVGGFIFGLVGLWLFRHGRKNANNRNVVIGLLLMMYPLFISSAVWTWAVGILLCGYAYYEWE
jgi:multisubunit Na+/H+ antiporter MnhE subunit